MLNRFLRELLSGALHTRMSEWFSRMSDYFSNLTGWRMVLFVFGFWWWASIPIMVLLVCIRGPIAIFRAEKEYQLNSPKNKLKRYFVLDFRGLGVPIVVFVWTGFLLVVGSYLDRHVLGGFGEQLILSINYGLFSYILWLMAYFGYFSFLFFGLGVCWLIGRTTVYLLGDLIKLFWSKGN